MHRTVVRGFHPWFWFWFDRDLYGRSKFLGWNRFAARIKPNVFLPYPLMAQPPNHLLKSVPTINQISPLAPNQVTVVQESRIVTTGHMSDEKSYANNFETHKILERVETNGPELTQSFCFITRTGGGMRRRDALTLASFPPPERNSDAARLGTGTSLILGPFGVSSAVSRFKFQVARPGYAVIGWARCRYGVNTGSTACNTLASHRSHKTIHQL